MTAPPTEHTSEGIVIVGAGGHGREIHEALRHNARVLGFVDDAFEDPQSLAAERVAALGVPALGTIEWFESNSPGRYALGLGTSTARRAFARRLDAAGATVTQVVHPGATIGTDVQLGAGVVLFDRATITTNVEIGAHTHLNVGCTVQHDSVVGSFVQFSPGVFVNGDCTIGDDVFLGTGAIVTRGCSIGEGATVGAGAVVLDDVPAGVRVVGAPARNR